MREETVLKIITGLNLVTAVVNWFLLPLVVFKVYGYFKGYTGIEMPDLGYWNIFALQIVLRMLFLNPLKDVHIIGIGLNNGDNETKKTEHIQVFVVLLVTWFFYWVLSTCSFWEKYC